MTNRLSMHSKGHSEDVCSFSVIVARPNTASGDARATNGCACRPISFSSISSVIWGLVTDLLSEASVAIDGSKFKAVNARDNVTRHVNNAMAKAIVRAVHAVMGVTSIADGIFGGAVSRGDLLGKVYVAPAERRIRQTNRARQRPVGFTFLTCAPVPISS
jgi:hypothetical protein